MGQILLGLSQAWRGCLGLGDGGLGLEHEQHLFAGREAFGRRGVLMAGDDETVALQHSDRGDVGARHAGMKRSYGNLAAARPRRAEVAQGAWGRGPSTTASLLNVAWWTVADRLSARVLAISRWWLLRAARRHR